MTPPVQPAQPAAGIPRIFVSHSHQDNNFCRPFVAHLRSALGLTDASHIFYDERSLHSGDDWMASIQQEVINRPYFIVILTPDAVASQYVRRETNLAIRRANDDPAHRRIFPLLVTSCDYNALAAFLGDYQFTDFVRKDYDTAFEDLVRAIRGGARDASGTRPTASGGGGPSGAAPLTPATARDPQAERARALATEAQAALAARDWSDAIARAEFALSLSGNQNSVELLTTLARAAAGAHDWTRARDAATRALALNQFDVALWLDLAAAQGALGQPDEALAALDRARAVVPRQDVATRLELLGARRDLLARQRRWDAALATLDDELALVPNDPARLAIKVDLLHQAGRDADALAVAHQITDLPGASAAHWLAYARLAHDIAHDRAEVSAALDAAARLAAPDDPAIAQARGELLPPPMPAVRFPERLAELGFTPRKIGGVEVIVPPLCDVPAGEFLMGSDPGQDDEADDDETPQHHVTLAAFQIARFPVTVAEYACAVRAGAVPAPGAYTYLKDATWIIPALRGRTLDWAAQLNGPDVPVVCVTWDNASAYATWLARITGQA